MSDLTNLIERRDRIKLISLSLPIDGVLSEKFTSFTSANFSNDPILDQIADKYQELTRINNEVIALVNEHIRSIELAIDELIISLSNRPTTETITFYLDTNINYDVTNAILTRISHYSSCQYPSLYFSGYTRTF